MIDKNKTFWEIGVNPITMLHNREAAYKHSKLKTSLKGNFIKKEELKDYVNINEFKKLSGLSAIKIKAILSNLNAVPKYFSNGTYYLKKYKKESEDYLNKEDVPDSNIDLYISNSDLMQMFQFSAFKAWDIAKKEKLLKVKLKGTKIYYNRIKAIETFKKYKV